MAVKQDADLIDAEQAAMNERIDQQEATLTEQKNRQTALLAEYEPLEGTPASVRRARKV